MNPNLTEIAFILDRSGSMQPLVEAAISGFNAFLDQQLDEPGDANLSLLLFDDHFDLIHDRVPVQDIRPLDAATFVPRGCTALLDAVGSAIKGLGRKLAKEPEEGRPGKVVIAIFTDGEENASVKYSMEMINKMISHQRDTYQWEFLFLAANQDAIASAAQMGIASHMAASSDDTARGIADSTRSMSRKISAIRKASINDEQDTDYHKPMSDILDEERRRED